MGSYKPGKGTRAKHGENIKTMGTENTLQHKSP